LPRAEGIRLDTHVLIFTALVSVFAGVLFGFVPALKMAHPNVQDTLKEGGRAMSSHQGVQGIFVVVEMAMALVLLTGAGLMIRSLVHLWSADPGFDPHNVLAFSVSLPNSQGTVSADALRSTFRQVHDKLASVPGVQSVSLSGGSIPMMSDDEELFWVEGQPKPATDKEMNWTLRYTIEPDYFRAMNIPLKRGRLLTPQDNENSALVATVDEAFAQRYFPAQDPVGKHINMKGIDRPLEIVGVVRHVKQWGIDSDDKQSLHAQLYAPLMQRTDQEIQQSATGIDVVLRTDAAHPATVEAIRNAIGGMNQGQFIYDVRPLDEVISKSLAAQRFSMILLGAFAALALLLATVGIYGVISYLVGQRTHEIGIRMAMGAQRWHILRLVLERGARLAAVGVGLGLAAALGITRLMASLLYGVGATDPLTFAGVTILLVLVALAACYIPARRATKVDPLVALRYE
jgi:predicted permease